MIRTYQIYSKPLVCNVRISYKDGIIHSFEADSPAFPVEECDKNRYVLFFTETGFLEAAKTHDISVTEIKREITFEMFWDRYNHKTVGGKIEADKAWKKLSKVDQMEAYDYIAYYESQLKLNPVPKLYAASYLNKKRWIK